MYLKVLRRAFLLSNAVALPSTVSKMMIAATDATAAAASCSRSCSGVRPLVSCSYASQSLFPPPSSRFVRQHALAVQQRRALRQRLRQVQAEMKPGNSGGTKDADETTRKYGLEAGLLKVFTKKDGNGQSKAGQAKELLARYGSAYLLTSISFAAVSFAVCYAAVNAGLDVADLLSRVGLEPSGTSEKVGTFALAYAAHKALSPVRFPPTVALTPVVAKLLGRKDVDQQQQEGEQN